MSEFVFEDGRKAEKIENNVDSLTKVTEVYVEPKQEKNLAKRITERLCVCEREIETINEETGEIVSRSIEKICEGSSLNQENQEEKLNIFKEVENKIKNNKQMYNYLFVAAIVAQLALLSYVLFGM